MIQIVKNRYLDALLKFILLTAIMHVVLLIIFSIVTLNVVPLNYFNILDLDSFFPNVIEGTLSQVLSVVVMVALYLAIFSFYTKR